MKAAQAQAARRTLDRRLSKVPAASQFTPPPRGWIRAIREALGMSGADLGKRLGVTTATVSDIERSESDRRVQLETLARVADALDCDFVYALVPRRRLEDVVVQTATAKVKGHIAAVGRGMDLESQSTGIDDAVVREEVRRLINSGRVWK
jgi:predicted DNA-binding mobile mystery protein A